MLETARLLIRPFGPDDRLAAHQVPGLDLHRALLAYAFQALHVRRMISTTDRQNIASAALTRRLDMRTATHPQHADWPGVVGVMDTALFQICYPSPTQSVDPIKEL